MSLIQNHTAPTAAVGANPNISELLRSTANACSASGCDAAPPVAVGLVLRATPTGAPITSMDAGVFGVSAGVAYLTATLDVDFRATDLMLSATVTKKGVVIDVGDNALHYIKVTSWTSNGIRDQNLLSETGVPGIAFEYDSQRRFGFDCAPTQARQQIVIAIENNSSAEVAVVGLLAGVCGDCNTTRRG